MFEKIKNLVKNAGEKILYKLNAKFFSNNELIELLALTFDEHLRWEEEIDLSTQVEYEIIPDFTSDEIAEVESQEKGSTKDRLLAVTSLYDENSYVTSFALEAIKDATFKLWPWQVKKEVQGIAKHEAFHIRQYNYIIKHGGAEAIDRLVEYMSTIDYEDNILEAGAYLYQWFEYVQDFESCFQQFIDPNEKELLSTAAATNNKK